MIPAKGEDLKWNCWTIVLVQAFTIMIAEKRRRGIF
jgi:hypothetical protein